jgi:hypothetical protein
MGYSSRYHAASLAAVFLALAIGILIGAGLGDNLVRSTRKNLEQSLTVDVQNARSRADDLASDLSRANEFGERIYPALVDGRLAGERIGVVGLGGLPGGITSNIEQALEPTGGRLVAVGVVGEAPNLGSLGGDLSQTRFADIASNPDTQQAFAKGIGRQLVVGGALLDKVRGQLFSRASGSFGNLDGVVIVRNQPTDLGPVERGATQTLESGIVSGIAATGSGEVGVEASDTDPSSIGFYKGANVSSVDNVDQVAGRAALIFALLGAKGHFGIKDSADRLLPELLTPGPVKAPVALQPQKGGSGNGGKNGGKTSKPGKSSKGR